MWRTVGQQRAKQTLEKALAKRLYGAYLFTGEEGVGRASLALEFLAGFVCEGAKPPCHDCSACRRVLGLTAPDLWLLTPQGVEPVPGGPRPREFDQTKRVGIGQVRQLTRELSRHPFEFDVRLVLVMDADRLTPEAQNAFLRSLEELDEETVFVLIASGKVLSTVASRCRVIRFSRLNYSEFSKIDFGPGADIELLNRVSGGSPGRARRYLEGDVEKQYKAAAQFAATGGISQIELLIASITTRSEARTFVDAFSRAIGDALLSSQAPPNDTTAGKGLTRDRLYALLWGAAAARERIVERNLTPRTVLRALLKPAFGRSYSDLSGLG